MKDDALAIRAKQSASTTKNLDMIDQYCATELPTIRKVLVQMSSAIYYFGRTLAPTPEMGCVET